MYDQEYQRHSHCHLPQFIHSARNNNIKRIKPPRQYNGNKRQVANWNNCTKHQHTCTHAYHRMRVHKTLVFNADSWATIVSIKCSKSENILWFRRLPKITKQPAYIFQNSTVATNGDIQIVASCDGGVAIVYSSSITNLPQRATVAATLSHSWSQKWKYCLNRVVKQHGTA